MISCVIYGMVLEERLNIGWGVVVVGIGIIDGFFFEFVWRNNVTIILRDIL